ncbi:hypothetical protein AMECASPLE_019137 [Ameca splendens]|uniref:Uncharacterized protein n=1 Tax=Ameca splendens TaxID=208324 RepID=A0ABV0ZCM5_9TELE
MLYTFRDGILHTLVVTRGYLSYCYLSIISNQSVHDALTSDCNKAFFSTQLLLTGYFLFFMYPKKMALLKNPSTSAVSEILRPGCLAPKTIQSHLNLLSSQF